MKDNFCDYSIVNGKTGLLIENGNVEAMARAIVSVLKDDKLRGELSKMAFAWARKFDWDKSAEEFLKIIERTTNERR